jgi:glycosyl transferase, family 25
MRAYVINLDRCADRLEHIRQEFRGARMPFERIPAVDAQDPEVLAAAARCLPGWHGRVISKGAFANFQSHRRCWKRLLDSGDNFAMIFEDDIAFAEGIADYLEDDWIPSDADIVRLEVWGRMVHVDKGKGKNAGARTLKRLRSHDYGTAGYVLARPAAERLLSLTDEIINPTDHVLFDKRAGISHFLGIYQMIPAPVIQIDRLPVGQRHVSALAPTILERFADAGSHLPPMKSRRAKPLAWLRGRLSNEWCALRQGTDYVRVPFG